MAPASGNPPPSTPASGSNPDDWFFDVARDVLGKDAGLHLHHVTGYPESSCYAYVAKNAESRRKPPEHFLRKLCHSEQGEPFHDAFMHGCQATWWLKRERERQLAALARDIFGKLGEVMKQ